MKDTKVTLKTALVLQYLWTSLRRTQTWIRPIKVWITCNARYSHLPLLSRRSDPYTVFFTYTFSRAKAALRPRSESGLCMKIRRMTEIKIIWVSAAIQKNVHGSGGVWGAPVGNGFISALEEPCVLSESWTEKGKHFQKHFLVSNFLCFHWKFPLGVSMYHFS